MRGASRTALAEAVAQLDQVTRSLDPGGLERLSDELFGVLHVIDSEHMLRRSLADPSRTAEAKTGVARILFEGKLSGEALGLVSTVAGSRWSRPSEMADAIEQLAVLAEVTRAERDGALDDVEDELFRFGRILEGQAALRNALLDATMPADGKVELIGGLLAGRARESTVRLIIEAVRHPRGRSPERALAAIGKAVSERRRRLVAIVTSAVPLEQHEKDRLASVLAGIYGHEVQVKAEVDPALLGGMTVQVGDEIVDGTIAGRLDRLKRR